MAELEGNWTESDTKSRRTLKTLRTLRTLRSIKALKALVAADLQNVANYFIHSIINKLYSR